MRSTLLATAALAAAFLASPASMARAEIEYPFCGFAREGAGGCTFSTLDQCRAFTRGAGGDCYSNPRYSAAQGRSRR